MLLKLIYNYFKVKKFFKKTQKFTFKKNLIELPITLIITSYNNKNYYQENLDSVLKQNYSNYNVIYIDDYSDDNTAQLVERHIDNFDILKKIKLIKNNIRKKKLANLYNVIHSLTNNRIIIELDGDDFLAHANVLNAFNLKYQEGYKLVYANYINNPIELAKKLKIGNFFQITPKLIVKNNMFREYPWVYSGLRSYCAGLFKQIKYEDLLYKKDNRFFPVCHDLAMFYPMLEMAREKVSWIEEPLLIRNINSSINDFKVYSEDIKQDIIKEIRNAPKYNKLCNLL